MCAGDDTTRHDIVWMVDGEERPFETLGDRRRHWLEESATWGSDGREPSPGDDPEPPELVWL